jgi:hypothetical protein
VPISGWSAGRVLQVDAAHCPAPLPEGKAAEAIRVDHAFCEV